MAKDDISDGFYNVFATVDGVKLFGIILPTPPGQEPLVLFFLVLPMGWVSAPPVFCAASETVADLTNRSIVANWKPPLHRLDKVADTPAESVRPPSEPGRPPRIRSRNKGPLGAVDAYVDDFILLAQGGKRRRRRLRRILFHCVDRVFRPPDVADDEWKKDPNSVKKLRKGDGSFTTVKVVLGWLLDTVAGTIELPPHRLERLMELLEAFPKSRKSCPKRELQRLVGELRSMIIAIPGGVGCLSWLQERVKEAGERVLLNQHFHDAIEDFRWLASDVGSRPTRFGKIVPEAPLYVGTADAAPPGMGGVWLPDAEPLYLAAVREDTLSPGRDTGKGESVAAALDAREAAAGTESSPAAAPRDPLPLEDPILWRHKFPPEISDRVVSFANPAGSVNNSELELAGHIGNNAVLASVADVAETTTATGTDNSASLSWSDRGAVSTTGPASYLLRLSSVHQRLHRYQQRNFFVPGDSNGMADDCSRLWNLSDDELLARFNTVYPQKKPWRLCQLPAEMASAIEAALLCKRLPLQTTLVELTDRAGTGDQRPWHLHASPAAHGHRKRLLTALGKRPGNWVSATGATVTTPRTLPSVAEHAAACSRQSTTNLGGYHH